jgi:hypothetical protein
MVEAKIADSLDRQLALSDVRRLNLEVGVRSRASRDSAQACGRGKRLSPHAALFYDQVSARLRVEIVEKLIAAGIEGPDIDGNLATGQNDLLAVEVGAFEF